MKLFKNKLKSDPSFCMFQTHKALVFTIISKVFLSMSRTSCCVVGKMTIISRCKNEKVLELIAILFCCLQWATLSPELVASSQWRSHWGQGGQSAPLTAKNLQKIGKKRGKIRKTGKKRKKNRRKEANREGSFTLPLLTDRAGYATASSEKNVQAPSWNNYFRSLDSMLTQTRKRTTSSIRLPYQWAVYICSQVAFECKKS